MEKPDNLPASPQHCEARSFAVTAHGDQLYSGEPYVVHLDHVVSVLREYGFHSSDLIDAAYLHDVLEDTAITYGNLREAGFSGRTRELVDAVTNAPGSNRRERNIATYPKMAGWTDATILKLADRIANSRRAHESGRERYLLMYRNEYAGFRKALYRDVPETRLMWEELDKSLAQGVGPTPPQGKAEEQG